MLYLLVGLSVGVVGTLVLLAPVIAHNRRRSLSNRRRIERLERRQEAHGFVIRHLAEESIEPDEPEPPPGRRGARISGGAAAVGVVALLVRRHPVSVGLAAAGGAVGAVVLAVSLAPMRAQGVPEAAGPMAPSSQVALYSMPGASSGSPTPPSRPSATRSAAASQPPTSGAPAAGSVPPESASGQPLLVVSLPLVKGSVVVPPVTLPTLPTVTLLPRSPIAEPTPTAPSQSGSATVTCVVDLSLPPLLRVCLP